MPVAVVAVGPVKSNPANTDSVCLLSCFCAFSFFLLLHSTPKKQQPEMILGGLMINGLFKTVSPFIEPESDRQPCKHTFDWGRNGWIEAWVGGCVGEKGAKMAKPEWGLKARCSLISPAPPLNQPCMPPIHQQGSNDFTRRARPH